MMKEMWNHGWKRLYNERKKILVIYIILYILYNDNDNVFMSVPRVQLFSYNTLGELGVS